MLYIPRNGKLLVEHNTGGVAAANLGAAVTTGASASAKGTPVELIASSAFDAYLVEIIASEYGNATTACQGALDILIGAATEAVLIENLLMGYCGGGAASATSPKIWRFPLYIPAGSRIAAQAAGARTSTAMRVAIFLYGGDGYPAFKVGQRVITYGMGTVPDGTSITPGANGAEGSWTQIVASTSEDHFCLVPSFQPTGDTSLVNKMMMLDLGIGSATEEEIAQSYAYIVEAQEKVGGPINHMPCFHEVPSGSRLSMRVSGSGAADSGYNGVIHAVS